MKKMIISVLMVVFVLALTTSAFATTISHSSSYFNSDWEYYDSGTNWVMIYGYNTSWINEDYTHTRHNTTTHTARVINGSGTFSKAKTAGSWAYVDVIHNGSPVTYEMDF